MSRFRTAARPTRSIGGPLDYAAFAALQPPLVTRDPDAMSEIAIHTNAFSQGSALPAQSDRIRNYVQYGVANGAGVAGATVLLNVVIPNSPLPASGNYFVDYDLPADYTVFTTNKTAAGFTVNIQPRLPGNSVAAGAFNFWVSW